MIAEPGMETARQAPTGHPVTCFTPGTLITTLDGKKPVEGLRPGDRLLTRDRGFQPLLWLGTRPVCAPTPDQCPVLVRAGALGHGRPERDIIVSPGHRFLTTDRALLGATGEPEALIEARALTGYPGIGHVPGPAAYLHLLLEQHEVILAENTWTESFRFTEDVARTMLYSDRHRVLQVFPRLREHLRDTVQVPARALIPAAAAGQARVA